ncbi:hypothetical protein N0V86_008475 [Didymella sp. IMI 355093]|nr:hypothetical protein N0V86_008475 [Didymella sp. IMI 355093]
MRDAALNHLKGVLMLGQKVTMGVPKTFQNDNLPTVPNSDPSTTADDNSEEIYHLIGQLGMADDREKRQAKNAEVTWGMSHNELHQRYVDQHLTLTRMPSGLEGSGQIVTGLSMTPPTEYMPAHIRATVPAPYDPTHLRVSMSAVVYLREYGWTLPGGNQDPAHQVISEKAWYGGPQAIQQRRKETKLPTETPLSASSRMN